ncbi:angiopoietin-related protein 1-like [Periplaneta americana]|uniref:angiopoietin-related protein 1-like n=1 Tax=Periplaneta americana TaxID=6978 RepID=UPI0037E8A729
MRITHSVISSVILCFVLTLASAQNDSREGTSNTPHQPSNLPPPKGRHGRRGRIRDTEGVTGHVDGIHNPPVSQNGDNFVVSNQSSHGTASGPREQDESGITSGTSDGDGLLDRAIRLLQRLNDRLTALSAIDEQQLRRLETLEYRLTKMEVQAQEKSDTIKTELREVSQRVRQLDWQSSKIEATLEAIKLDTNGLKHGQDQIRGMQAGPEGKGSVHAQDEIHSKMQMTMAAVYTMRATLGSMKDDLNNLKLNFTKLSNMTSNMFGRSTQYLTKQYFTEVMLDHKHETVSPVQALPLNLLASLDKPSHDLCEDSLPHDCLEVQKQGHNTSGIYRIKPHLSSAPFFVYCQLETRGGGWTVVQNRYEGTVDFYRNWQDYKHGFGNIGGEFWLGLEKLYTLTNYKVTEILIELQDFNLEKVYAQYAAFAVGTEVEGYAISFLGSYEGDAGDSLVYHAGMKFSTHDVDHDNWHDGNCAESHSGAWWYNGCDTSNLNGRYLNGELPEMYEYHGMYWYDWHGPAYSLMKSRISVRPSQYFHSHLVNRDLKVVNNKTKNNATKPANRHRQAAGEDRGTEENFTEKKIHDNLGVEDSPPKNEDAHDELHRVTEHPTQTLPHYDNNYDYIN